MRASDVSLYGYLEVTVTVDDVNEAPAITTTSKTAFTYRESGTATIYTFKATDPEKSNIEWTLSGPDANAFTLSDTGVMDFASPPTMRTPLTPARTTSMRSRWRPRTMPPTRLLWKSRLQLSISPTSPEQPSPRPIHGTCDRNSER